MTITSKLCRVLLLGSILFSTSGLRAADVIAVSQSNGGRLDLMGPEGIPGTRVANLDTKTGEFSDPKLLTTRQGGSFTAMARDGAGTLYAVQQYPSAKLVTIDETTGIATDVAIISDSAGEGYQLRGVPEMAFVGETLYAIINRDYEDSRPMFIGEEEVLSSIDTGFILVTINLETGATSETGIYLGGQYDGRAHGLAYDDGIGLIHFYYHDSENDSPSSGSSVELIDIDGSTTESIEFYTESMDSSQPGRFQGVAALGGGQFLIYNNHGGGFYMLTISESMTPPTPVGPMYTWDATYLSLSLSIYGVRALETAGEGFVLEHSGYLEYYDTDGAETSPPVRTSVGGFPAPINSIATNPDNGGVVALGYSGNGKGRPRSVTSKDLEMKTSGQGLFQIRLDGAESEELSELAVEFYNSGELYLAGNIEAITFDEKGALYGFAEHVYDSERDEDFNYLVKINLQTGEVIPVAELGMDMGYGYQLEYNPEDGNFYVLYYYSYDGSELALDRVSKSGTVTPVELSGKYPSNMRPNSLVFVGLHTFIFTMENQYEGGDFIFELTSDGEITSAIDPEMEDEKLLSFGPSNETFYTTGLARAGSFAKGDVAIGEKFSRLRGKNRYSASGAGQSIRVKKTVRRLKADYFASLENDGAYAGLMRIKGSKGSRKTRITYKAGGRNVTGSVVRGAPLELGPGFDTKVKVSVIQRGGKRLRANNRLSICYGSASDLAKAKLQLSTKGRGNGSVKPTGLF